MNTEQFLAIARNIAERNGFQNRLDSANLGFAAKQLEELAAEAYNVQYAPLEYRGLVPVLPGQLGASHYTYNQWDRAGVAQIIADYASNAPRVDLKLTQFSAPYRDLAASYAVSMREMESALFAGVPLSTEKASAARLAVEEKLDSILRTGDAAHGLFGLLNIAAATTANAPNGVGGTATWATKTPDEILDDLNNTVSAQVALTKGVEKPNTIVLPIAQYNLIASKSLGDGREGTILSFFIKNSPYVKSVFQNFFLAGAGVGGVDRAVIYNRNPMKIHAKVNREFSVLPPVVEGMSQIWNCLMGTCGVVSPYPLSITYLDGI